jgi:hypothetical protein
MIALLTAAMAIACGDDAPPGDQRNPLYVGAETAMKNGCGSKSNSCHSVGGGKAMFDLSTAIASGDIRTAMVNIPSCEYNVMDRIEPGDPANSWVYIKLTGTSVAPTGTARDGDLMFTPNSTWTEADKCNATITGFGKRMPNVAPFQIEAEPLAAIEAWIRAGAPGPNDPLGDAGP